MVLFPLLAFEATLKYGGRGLLLSAAGLVAGIGGRMSWRFWHFGLSPRWHVALLVVAATGVLIGVAFALRTRCAAEAGARAEKERIAASLRATVTELLATTLEPTPQLNRLTAREREILRLLADGLTDRQAAARLFLAAGTVRVHVSNIVHQLGVPNRPAHSTCCGPPITTSESGRAARYPGRRRPGRRSPARRHAGAPPRADGRRTPARR